MSLLRSRFPAVITQADWDSKLDTSTKLLGDLDIEACDKLFTIYDGAEPNVGEEFTTAEKTKLTGVEEAATKYPDVGEQPFLDADHTKLDGVADGADVNVGEEFTPAEQAKLAKLGADNVPIEVLAAEPGTPVEGDMYYDDVELKYKRYNGISWDIVELTVEVVT